jgi:phospholipid/cholesterol/gamma-HCH transport system substrate-binding protein
MRALFKENLIEALVGLLVVLLGVWFVVFAYSRTGGGANTNSYRVEALFPNISGVYEGTDVRVAGMKVGTVKSASLDPESYQAKLTLMLDRDFKVPVDSSAAITSEGIMGGTYVALLPGGDPTPLKDGDVIADTQGAMDLMAMIGQYINGTGGMSDQAQAGAEAPAETGGTMAPQEAAPAQP